MKKISLVLVMILMFVDLSPAFAAPVLTFSNRSAIEFRKILKVGEIELLEFANPVSLAHYGTSEHSLDYIELEKLEPSTKGYRKFMVKAKAAGTGELTFQSAKDVIKVKVIVQEDYSQLEAELNSLFGIKGASEEQRIKVITANVVSDIEKDDSPHIYLQGEVETAKNALLALSFAANAVGDSGVKIFSNPGGQLRFKDLDKVENQSSQLTVNYGSGDDGSFAEYYDSMNQLIDTDNLYRDLILASENDKVISYIKVKEPKRYAIKVRFLEMDSRHIDDFINTVSTTSRDAGDFLGSFGANDNIVPDVSRADGLISSNIIDSIQSDGTIGRLTDTISSGSLVSGAVKILDNAFLNVNLNNLLQEGILRIANEFSLITHSGESVSLGKGIRFPIPQINNSVGNSSITYEYIPIGFKGELKVTDLDNELIDVQLASRLSSAESNVNSGTINIPIFTEEYVNSGALLKDGQEVILNAFLTETEKVAKSTSPLGRLIPFFGRSKKRQKAKNLLFIALMAEEISPSSLQAVSANPELPHLDLSKGKNIYADYNAKLREMNITDTVDLAAANDAKKAETRKNADSSTKVDPLGLEGVEF